VSNGSIPPLFELVPPPGFPLRHPLEPMAGSSLLTWGTTGNPSADFRGIPRPSGGASVAGSIGALERANSFARVSSGARTGTYCLEATGPAVQDFKVAVEAQPTTVSLYVWWDGTYAGTKPSLSVLHGAQCGVADDTEVASGSASTWEQITLSFTPTAAGVVTIRLTSSDTNGAGVTRADDAEITRADVRGFNHEFAGQPAAMLFDATEGAGSGGGGIPSPRAVIGRGRSRL
jgi:hypothetical protein